MCSNRAKISDRRSKNYVVGTSFFPLCHLCDQLWNAKHRDDSTHVIGEADEGHFGLHLNLRFL